MFKKPEMKKAKSKHSQGSGGQAKGQKNLMENESAGADQEEKKLGFFQNFRKLFGQKQPEAARSQGVLDHIDPVDLMDLAADLGCISVDEKSFTFKPDEDSAGNDQGSKKNET